MKRVRLRLGVEPLAHQRDREVVQRRRLVGARREAALQVDFRAAILLLHEVAHADREVRGRIVRVGRQHLLRVGARQAEVRAVEADLETLAQRQARPLLHAHPVHLLPQVRERLVFPVQLVGHLALRHREVRLTRLVERVRAHPGHARQAPLRKDESALERTVRDGHRIALVVQRQNPVRDAPGDDGPHHRPSARRAAVGPRHEAAASRHGQVVVPPQLEPQLDGHVRHPFRPVAHPGAQRVGRARREKILVLRVERVACAQVDVARIAARHHRERAERLSAHGGRHLESRVQRAVREQARRVGAFHRRRADERARQLPHLVRDRLPPVRQHERDQHERLAPEQRPP